MSETVTHHPAGDHGGGIHLPKPSFTPLIWGLGFMLIAFGIILGGNQLIPGTRQPVPAFSLSPFSFFWLSAGGVVVILIATGGWLWGNIRERIHGSETPEVAAKFAMWCFLGTEVIIFGALIARVVSIWLVEPEAHAVLTEPIFPSLVLVSVNTFLLLVSSLAVVLGLSYIQEDNKGGLILWLAVTALLGATFVGIQGYEYSKLVHEGVVFGDSQFASAFYLLTGNHGLHVIIGVIWCVVVVIRAAQGAFTKERHLGVEIFGLYWHFVDVVWIIIFTLVYLI
jgi:heme/copper-type cytochrome/quinol oxidase subunit 3